jgi:hypothetical protein
MATTMPNLAATAPRMLPASLRLSTAKANLTNREHRPRVGDELERAIGIVGLSIKEAAALLGVEPAQVSRWIAGAENVQIDRLYATKLHGPFAIEMARDAEGCTVETTVTYRAVAR